MRDLERLEALRLSVALALMGRPRLLAVDDTDLKLSAPDRALAWELLRGLAAGGTTVAGRVQRVPRGRAHRAHPPGRPETGYARRHDAPGRKRPMRSPRLAALELRRFGRGRMPRAALVALLLLPLLYGALYLWSFWDPYGRLDRIPVALVNDDKGASAGGETPRGR